MPTDFPILSATIWLPIIGGLWVVFRSAKTDSILAEALGFSVATFFLSLIVLYNFDYGTPDMQFVEKVAWIPVFGIDYFVGLDGISLPLVLLTTFITVVIILAAGNSITDRPGFYLGSFLILEGVMVGVFSALDAVLFYVFWEAMLIPMFLIIGIWGGENRVYATIKFFLYTLLGSLLMLVALLYLYFVTGSFSIEAMHLAPLDLLEQQLLFLAFLFAFAVKVPMWPVHTWLPDAHVEAPTGGSVVLAAIMLKMGGYGFIRFSLPIAPDAAASLDSFMITLSLIAVFYIGLVALVQDDMKKLIAYSSISHMGFVTLGLFVVFSVFAKTGRWEDATMGIEGAMVQMISHGFVSGALFLCVGVLYDRVHSKRIKDYGGVAKAMPMFAAFMMLFSMANAGLPGTSGFVGEFLVIMTAFKSNFWFAFLAASTLVLGAAYTLWMYKRVIFGEVANEAIARLPDINRRERLILSSLAFAVLAIGIWPAPLFELMQASIGNLIEHIGNSKL